jgi:hypothetical protein
MTGSIDEKNGRIRCYCRWWRPWHRCGHSVTRKMVAGLFHPIARTHPEPETKRFLSIMPVLGALKSCRNPKQARCCDFRKSMWPDPPSTAACAGCANTCRAGKPYLCSSGVQRLRRFPQKNMPHDGQRRSASVTQSKQPGPGPGEPRCSIPGPGSISPILMGFRDETDVNWRALL